MHLLAPGSCYLWSFWCSNVPMEPSPCFTMGTKRPSQLKCSKPPINKQKNKPCLTVEFHWRQADTCLLPRQWVSVHPNIVWLLFRENCKIRGCYRNVTTNFNIMNDIFWLCSLLALSTVWTGEDINTCLHDHLSVFVRERERESTFLWFQKIWCLVTW